MDSRNLPYLLQSGNQEPNALPLYNRYTAAPPAAPNSAIRYPNEPRLMTTFEFYRFRFHFRAIDAVHFPEGKSANVVRGSFGMILRDTAPPAIYSRLFEPGKGLGAAPSGLADWPRPFIFRASHLDGLTIVPGGGFHFDLHVFDLHEPALDPFRTVFARMAAEGLGPGRGRAVMERVDQLDMNDCPTQIADGPQKPSVLDFTPGSAPVSDVKVRFKTPTELKSAGTVSDRPEFAVLFGRLRDRLSTLRALYGPGPMDVDFAALGELASAIRLRQCDLRWEKVERKSRRTGQVHPLGGFTGVAEYQGDLIAFLPWLLAARWVGVGRQTVWGKGDVRVME
jgi:hypothetical protein